MSPEKPERPREWWIAFGQGVEVIFDLPQSWAVHVIEHSAYAKLAAERDQLREQVLKLEEHIDRLEAGK